jgi:hypothetical protein
MPDKNGVWLCPICGLPINAREQRLGWIDKTKEITHESCKLYGRKGNDSWRD